MFNKGFVKLQSIKRSNVDRRVATCKPGKPGLTSFSETLALFFTQFLSLRKMKVQDRQNGPSGLPEKKLDGYAPGWVEKWTYHTMCHIQKWRTRPSVCTLRVSANLYSGLYSQSTIDYDHTYENCKITGTKSFSLWHLKNVHLKCSCSNHLLKLSTRAANKSCRDHAPSLPRACPAGHPSTQRVCGVSF